MLFVGLDQGSAVLIIHRQRERDDPRTARCPGQLPVRCDRGVPVSLFGGDHAARVIDEVLLPAQQGDVDDRHGRERELVMVRP